VFFEKEKEYAPKIVSLILPALAPLAYVPSSSAPSPTVPAPAEVA
jgi:hypothetical protein